MTQATQSRATNRARAYFEGNVFMDVTNVASSTYWEAGSRLLSSAGGSGNDVCGSAIGRNCTSSIYTNSAEYEGWMDTSFVGNWGDLTTAECAEASEIKSTVPASAGNILSASGSVQANSSSGSVTASRCAKKARRHNNLR
ncbi:hypothetical protein BJX65DRAFT_302640 [Aspergillus insuetus]